MTTSPYWGTMSRCEQIKVLMLHKHLSCATLFQAIFIVAIFDHSGHWPQLFCEVFGYKFLMQAGKMPL
jgi:hypothetical protein